jgi:SOS-response transcriptional repressor LexA
MSIDIACLPDTGFTCKNERMTTIGSRVKEAREAKGLTQAELAAIVKPPMAQQSIGDIESGKTKNPRPDTIQKIAEALGVKKEWLLIGDEVEKYTAPTYYLPMFSFQEMINFPFCMEDTAEKENKEKVPMSEKGYEHCYILPVTNDLMEPRFKAGDLLVVDPGRQPKDGSFVIAYQSGAPEIVFKKYVVDGANRYLRSLNGDVPRIDVDESIKIFGVVVRKRPPDDIIERG